MEKKTSLGWILYIGLFCTVIYEVIWMIYVAASYYISSSTNSINEELSVPKSVYTGVSITGTIILIAAYSVLAVIPYLLYLIHYIKNESDKMKRPTLFATISWGLVSLILLIIFIHTSTSDLLNGNDKIHAMVYSTFGLIVLAFGLFFFSNLVMFITAVISSKNRDQYDEDGIERYIWILELVMMTIYLVLICVDVYNSNEYKALGLVTTSSLNALLQVIINTLLCIWMADEDKFYTYSDYLYGDTVHFHK